MTEISFLQTEVYVFLFTDMLLLTKFKERKSERVKVIKPPMRLDHVLVFMLKDGMSFLLVHLNEFNVASAMYTLHGDAKNWVTIIEKAQVMIYFFNEWVSVTLAQVVFTSTE